MGSFGRSSASLVYVVQYNIDEKVCRIIDTSALDGEAAKVLGEAVPSVKLAEIDIVDLESRNVLEREQGHGRVEWELLVSCD